MAGTSIRNADLKRLSEYTEDQILETYLAFEPVPSMRKLGEHYGVTTVGLYKWLNRPSDLDPDESRRLRFARERALICKDRAADLVVGARDTISRASNDFELKKANSLANIDMGLAKALDSSLSDKVQARAPAEPLADLGQALLDTFRALAEQPKSLPANDIPEADWAEEE